MLETERLALRPWDDRDAPALYRLACDPAVGLPAGWPAHTDEAESLRVIREVLRGPESYAICLRGEDAAGGPAGTLVGAIALMGPSASDLAEGPDEYEIGYWVGRPFWGRGYMREAARRLIDHARDDLGARAIWGAHYVGNGRSHRVMEKCGLAYVRTDRSVDVPLLCETRDQVVMRAVLGRSRFDTPGRL